MGTIYNHERSEIPEAACSRNHTDDTTTTEAKYTKKRELVPREICSNVSFRFFRFFRGCYSYLASGENLCEATETDR